MSFLGERVNFILFCNPQDVVGPVTNLSRPLIFFLSTRGLDKFVICHRVDNTQASCPTVPVNREISVDY